MLLFVLNKIVRQRMAKSKEKIIIVLGKNYKNFK